MQQRRVVLVEDEPDVRGLVRVHLDGLGQRFEVVADVDTAEAAIDVCDRVHPDVIVLDNQLAGKLTGVEAAPLLKAGSPSAAIVLYSASVSDVGPLPDGVDAVVSKTAPLLDLGTTILQVSGALGA